MRKNNILALAATLLSLILVSCEGKIDPPGHRGGVNGSKAAVEENIDALVGNPWSKNAYLEILNNQIPELRGLQRDKDVLKEKLDNTYGKVMVADGNQILDKCDAKQHTRLKDLMKELAGFEGIPGKEELTARYKKHEELLSFVASMKKLQSVKSLDVQYDVAFETDITKKVNAHLATNPTCSYITSELKKKDAYFKNRRTKYAEALLSLYCERTTWDKPTETKVKSSILKALKVSTMPQDYVDRLEAFKQKIEEQEQNN